jgi:signal transduction histidine kinase
MLRIYGCITDQHDLRLVVLAGLICFLACYTASNLMARAREADNVRSLGWLFSAAIVFGGGVWATHFVAMLAFQPGLAIGYDIGLTLISIGAAMSISWLGFAAALRLGAVTSGGAMLGVAIGTMHYIGMKAMIVPAEVNWAEDLVSVSLAIGIVVGAIALRTMWRQPDLRHQLGGALLLTIAICGLHFSAMAAVGLSPDPLIAVSDQVMAPEWLAVAVAMVTVLIIALGLFGSVVDQHLAGRAAQEAERLRAHIGELEATKHALEGTTSDLETALEAAAAASQAKSQFLATMSHELRTPLNAIIGFSEMLVSETFGSLGDRRYPDYAKSIRDSGRHLLDLINDILDFSKLDAGRLELHEETVNLHEIVDGALQMMHGEAARTGIRIHKTLAQELPDLFADQRRVRQVLLNLLSNAVKFTPEGGEVKVATFRRGSEVGVAVADTGIGIAAEDIPRALERFGQVDSSLSRKYEGTGLGLPLSKRLMELHDGRLELESIVGAGTTVTILFPAKRLIEDQRAA